MGGQVRPAAVLLHVDELLLEGFGAGDRDRIGAAVRTELGRLLAEQGVPPALAPQGSSAGLDGGAFEVHPAAGPEAVGVQVARAVYGALAR